jgi:Arc/MetJ family transcription regulator
MTKKLVDIDEGNLARAAQILETTTMKDTVNRALVEVIELSARRAHAQRLARMEDLDLADETVMGEAWR